MKYLLALFLGLFGLHVASNAQIAATTSPSIIQATSTVTTTIEAPKQKVSVKENASAAVQAPVIVQQPVAQMVPVTSPAPIAAPVAPTVSVPVAQPEVSAAEQAAIDNQKLIEENQAKIDAAKAAYTPTTEPAELTGAQKDVADLENQINGLNEQIAQIKLQASNEELGYQTSGGDASFAQAATAKVEAQANQQIQALQTQIADLQYAISLNTH